MMSKTLNEKRPVRPGSIPWIAVCIEDGKMTVAMVAGRRRRDFAAAAEAPVDAVSSPVSAEVEGIDELPGSSERHAVAQAWTPAFWRYRSAGRGGSAGRSRGCERSYSPQRPLCPIWWEPGEADGGGVD